ncbi:ArdC-like ssDNA-binding domain-containing protein [Actinomyces provencensis]|uniref:ArdC-like ssDNA-binding domain-containing protein n=1 Tax=Actinomyces provencensis TaxID=1720198 RepID=UPI00096A815C|nr:ArdC-like ssDNA-binding domain-containing protein [Actinomyces provencensis]
MATRQETRRAREAKLDELHEKLTGAVEQLVSGPDWARALAFAARFRTRSFSNSLLIWAQHAAAYEAGRVPEPFPSYVAGYKQWQALGRQVEKGQPGYQILAPVTGRFASANPADADSWRRLGKGEKPRPGEVVRSKMVGVRPAYVWDASQTTGDPIPEPPSPRLLEGEAPAELWDGLAAQVEERGFTVLRVPHEGMIHGANGMTDYTANTVAVRENMDPAAQVKTLAHELGHVLLHGPDQDEARQHRGIGEVEAESVALMVGAAHGMDTSGYTIPYVSTWAARVDGKEPVEVVKATGERVRKTARAILDQLDTAQVGDGTPPGLDRDVTHRETPAHVRPAPEPAPSRQASSLPEPGVRPVPVPALEGRGL